MVLALTMAAAAQAALAQSTPWQRLENHGASYAGTINDAKQSISFICSSDGNASMVVSSPTFRVSVPDGNSYSLILVTDRERLDLVVTSKDSDLTYHMKDLNAHVTIERLAEDIRASAKITAAVARLGWQVEFSAEGAAEALDGIFAHC